MAWFFAFRFLATSYLYVPIFMLFLQARGLSFSEQLALGGIYSAVVVLVEVPTGVVADAIGRRKVMICGALIMAMSCFVMIEATSFAHFVCGEILAALSMALCSGADSAYLYDYLVSKQQSERYPRSESIASAFHLAGSAIAFFTGGCAAVYGLHWPYVVTAVIAVLAAFCAYQLPEPAVRQQQRVRWAHATWQALGVVRRSSELRWLIAYSAIAFVLLRATIYLYQPVLAQRGLSFVALGAIYASVYLTASAVAIATPTLMQKSGTGPLLWGNIAFLALGFAVLAWADSPVGIAVALTVQAFCHGVYSPVTKPLLNRHIDSHQRAAVLSVESMVRRAAMGVCAPLVGLAGQANAAVLVFAFGAAGMLVLACFLPKQHAVTVSTANS